MFLLSSCSCLCPIHWSRVLHREWRCSWSSDDRRCSNYIWVINNLIAYLGASYIRVLTAILWHWNNHIIGIGAIVWLPQCQLSNPGGYGWIIMKLKQNTSRQIICKYIIPHNNSPNKMLSIKSRNGSLLIPFRNNSPWRKLIDHLWNPANQSTPRVLATILSFLIMFVSQFGKRYRPKYICNSTNWSDFRVSYSPTPPPHPQYLPEILKSMLRVLHIQSKWKPYQWLVQDCIISSANALEILQSWTKPLIWCWGYVSTLVQLMACCMAACSHHLTSYWLTHLQWDLVAFNWV